MKWYVIIFLVGISTINAIAQQNDLTTLVQRIVHESVMIKRGEVVYVFGGPHASSLIENIVAECSTLGANAFSIICKDKVELSDQVGSIPFKNGFLNKSKLFDSLNAAQVWILISPFVEDPETSYGNVAEEQMIQLAKVEQEIYAEAAKHHVRILHVSHPYASTSTKSKSRFRRLWQNDIGSQHL